MANDWIDPHGNFTDAECVIIARLFQRLIARGAVPLVVFALNHHGRPCGVFNSALTSDDADRIGAAITAQLEVMEAESPS